jgi:tetratricopeptide (TPR) repeat protein
MAAKVNTRFVLMLGLSLVVLVGGVAAVAVYVKLKSPERNVALGDAKMAEAKYAAAAEFYAQAVNKEQQNIEYLNKWRAALLKIVPENEVVFGTNYTWLMRCQRALAVAQKTNVQAHRDYLDFIYLEAAGSAQRGTWELLASETDTALRYFDSVPPQPSGWHVLRRYRGLGAITLANAGLEVSEDKVRQGREDLEAALAADPADSACAVALSAWHRRQAFAAKANRDAQGERSHLEAADALIRAVRAAAPRDPVPILAAFANTVEDALRSVDTSKPNAEIIAERKRRLATLGPTLDQTVEALRGVDGAKLGLPEVFQFYRLADYADPQGALARTRELIDRLLAERPGAADLIYLKGRLLAMQREGDAAIIQLQKVIDLPRPTVGLDGARQLAVQRQAFFWQAYAALSMVGSAEGPDRDAALARARTYRDKLAGQVAKDSPDLLFIDARILIAEGRFENALTKLTEYSRVTGDATSEAFEAVALSGELAERLRQDGRAADLYERALAIRPGTVELQLALAEVRERLNQMKAAATLYKEVLDAQPDNEKAKNKLAILKALAGEQGTVTDPVLNVMVQADRLQNPSGGKLGDLDAALALLEGAMPQHNYDPRLVGAVVTLRLTRNDRAGAQAAIDRALAARPDDKDLLELRRRLAAVGSLDGALQAIEAGPGSPLDKLLSKRAAYLQYNKTDEAARTLTEAVALPNAADDPRVVEALFLTALDRKDMTEATRQADKAAAGNMDLADGLTFRARMQITQGNYRDAAVTLSQALEKRGPNPSVLRLLGDVQMRQGRPLQAIERYREAQRLSPADPAIVKPLLMALGQTQQQAEALRVARDADPLMGGDPQFANIRYLLEAVAGNRETAVSGRERLLDRYPDDDENASALITLYIEDRAWPKARTLLDARRAKRDSLALAGLDARWHADQGNLEAAKAVWIAYLDRLTSAPEKMGPEPYMTFGQFLIQRGQVDAGLSALRKAAEFQNPKTRLADFYLGDTLLGLGRHAEAEKVYTDILAAGVADPTLLVTSRLVETLVQQGKYAQAEQRIASLGDAAGSSLALTVLRAHAAERSGDARKARELLNRAVEQFPDDPLPFFRRALLLAQDPAFQSDAVADLDRAVQLRPSYWEALQTRAAINMERGRTLEALNDLRVAVETNPFQDELRMTYMAELIRNDRERDAVEVGRAAMRLRPSDVALPTGLAHLFAQRGLWASAAVFYKQTWELTRDSQDAAAYTQALLRTTPPNLAEVDAVLATPGLKIETAPGLLMTRAELRSRQNAADAATRDVMAAYQLTCDNPDRLSLWYTALLRAMPEAATRIRVFERVTANPATVDWLKYMWADTVQVIPARHDEGLDAMEKIAAATRDAALKTSLARTLQGLYMNDKKPEKALAACRMGLEVNPKDWILNNNAATFLVEQLGRASEALPFALAAAEVAPDRHEVLDTLASTYSAMGDRAKAMENYERALNAADAPPDKARYLLRLVQGHLDAGEPAKARAYAESLRRMQARVRQLLTDDQSKELDEYERRIERSR